MSEWWKKHAPFSILSTPEEVHAFIIGWAETACPWRARYKLIKEEAEYGVWKEAHYYLVGRVAGFGTFALQIVGIAKLIEVIF